MSRYHAGFTTAAVAAGATFVDFRSATTDRCRILEIGIFNTAATATLISLERSTTIGTASTTLPGQSADVGEGASSMAVGTAWSVAPASTAVPLRRMQAPSQIGAGIIWSFGLDDLIIPISGSVCLFNRGAAASGIMTGYVTWDE